MARKPLIGTVAENVLTYGTGALNIDASRIGTQERTYKGGSKLMDDRPWDKEQKEKPEFTVQGRWPANVILDESSAELLDEQSGLVKGNPGAKQTTDFRFMNEVNGKQNLIQGDRKDIGGASRFFYVAKASKRDRNEGLESQNLHPTVKPTELMKYLIKLVTRPNGTVLDPFTGSGSTGKAALIEGFRFIGIEMTEDYIPIIEGRLKNAEEKIDEGLF
jgi:site-specific DNA-methyltransferase (adenine-specific)